jgi:hypothetical protein
MRKRSHGVFNFAFETHPHLGIYFLFPNSKMTQEEQQWVKLYTEGLLYKSCSNKKEYNKAYHWLVKTGVRTPRKKEDVIFSKNLTHDERLQVQRRYMAVWRARNKGWNTVHARRYNAKKKAEKAAAF